MPLFRYIVNILLTQTHAGVRAPAHTHTHTQTHLSSSIQVGDPVDTQSLNLYYPMSPAF